jgi:hypothetical protein
LKKFFVYPLILTLFVMGCGKGEKAADKNDTIPGKEDKTVALMESEKDTFNAKSTIESQDKFKLTSFGLRKTPMPEVFSTTQKAQLALQKPDLAKLNILTYKPRPLLIPAFPFDYENDVEALKKLYKSHELGKIIKPDMKELDILKAIMLYTYNFMQGGTQPSIQDDLGPSGELITKLRKEKGIGGSSRHYSALFCQLALSCGFNARLISMHGPDGNGGVKTNDVCEVFMNSFDKWVAFDTFSKATVYLNGDIPLSALELRNLMLDENYRAVKVDSGISDFTETIDLREKLLPCYRYLYLWRMNDILGKSPDGGSISWKDLYRKHLVWEDERAPISDGAFDKSDKFGKENPVRFIAHNRDDLYWPLNHVTFSYERIGNDKIKIYFNTITPNFAGYRIDDAGVWNEKGDDYILKGLLTEIKIQSINSLGVYGPVSSMQLSM